ncbi:MAG: hypothetical protein OXG16_11920 [Rhodospirillales bacterium]|nr:hypothetical protein [Rhodospirillales bacterium]
MALQSLHRPFLGLGIASIILAAACESADAQDVSLNYENLSSLEEPLATEVGDVTLVLTGLLDASLSDGAEHDGTSDTGLIGNAQLAILTQLSNSWRVSLTYFGQYATEGTAGFRSDERTIGNGAVSIGSAWGTILGGDVSGIVREQTRRHRGVGNGVLAFDDVMGQLDEFGGAYLGRFGPWVLSAVADGDGNLDTGAMFQRPAGNRDYRITFRATDGVYHTALERFDTRAAAVVVEMIYGSTTLDAGVGLERLASSGRKADRRFVSAGVRTKAGVVGFSIGAHFGRIEGQDEQSAALGIQYDLARGLSANLGLNHRQADVTVDGATFLQVEETEAVVSMRYSF